MEKFLASHPPTAQRLSYAEGRVGQYAKEHPKKADQPLKRDEFLKLAISPTGFRLGTSAHNVLMVDGAQQRVDGSASLRTPTPQHS